MQNNIPPMPLATLTLQRAEAILQLHQFVSAFSFNGETEAAWHILNTDFTVFNPYE